jgi:hypothetical protein
MELYNFVCFNLSNEPSTKCVTYMYTLTPGEIFERFPLKNTKKNLELATV